MIAYLVVSSFLISLLTLVFFFAVLLKGVRSDGGRNLTFCLFSASIFVWAIGHMFWQLASTEAQALFWTHVFVVGSIFVPYTYFHFTINITQRYELRLYAYFGYLVALCLTILSFWDLVVLRVEPRFGFDFWPVPGSAFPAYLGGFVAMVLVGVSLLFGKYREAAIETKNQYKYILLGTGIGFAGGATNFFLWFNIPIPPFGHLLVIAYILGLGYSMLKYRILDFSEMAFRILGMLLVSILFSSVVALGLVLLLGAVYQDFYPNSYIFWAGVCLVISVILLPLGTPFYEYLSSVLHDRFLAHRFAYRSDLKQLSEEASLGVDTDESITLLAHRLSSILMVEDVAFYIRSEADFDFHAIGCVGERKWHERVSASDAKFLLEYFSENHSAVVLDELNASSKHLSSSLSVICGERKALREADLVVPVSGLREVLGFLVLGRRRARSIFADIDFLLLENLCSQLGLALKLREVDRISSQMEKLVSLGTMAAGLSHELRNPLVSIRTLASFLRKTPENLVLTKAFSATVQRDVKRISGIVEGVATFAQNSKTPLSHVSVAESVLEAQNSLVEKMELNRIDFKLKVQPDIPDALGNSEQLIQVFQNTLENAINAISEWADRPEEGLISVYIHLRSNQSIGSKQWVEVDIADNGPGMSVEFQERVFDPFVTSRDTGQRSGASGTGLGLAIVNKIVEHHGGLITLHSKLGKGAQFKISLPIAR